MGLWTSVASGHGCPRQNAFFSGFGGLIEAFDARCPPGYHPAHQHLLFGLRIGPGFPLKLH